VVVIVSRPWDLQRPPHQVHIDALASSVIARRDHVELGTCAALELRNIAEPVLVLCGRHFIGARPREPTCVVLKA
jgi:hypothetical protein